MKSSYIGLMVEHRAALAVGLWGILKSGRCLVPINPGFPDDRVVFMLRDCDIKTVLTDKENYPRLKKIAESHGCLKNVICIDDIDMTPKDVDTGQEGAHDDNAVVPDTPCYVIYTSGSTGKPKGVQISHRNLLPLLVWFDAYFNLGPHTRVLQNLSYTFDFGFFELVTTALCGGTLYFFDRKGLNDLNEYADFICRHRIDTVHSTPSFFNNITGLGRPLPSLGLVHLGGEKLTQKTIQKTAQLVAPDCRIYNGYGPTETTINSSIYSICLKDGQCPPLPDNIPIGKPTANNIVYIVDGYGNLLPPGVVGELVIGGGGVAAGYLNRPLLTSTRFVDNYSQPGAGAIFYKTGDLGRWLPDGNIEFLGRVDHQVKIRGFRIELGEIEENLLSHDGAADGVVIAREDPGGDKYLCAYVVPGPGEVLRSEELRAFQAQKLPEYMVPAYYVFLDTIPLNSNGKADLKALPEPDLTAETNLFVAPQNPVEKKLAQIWAQLLDLDVSTLGSNTDFFQVGGHSLKATLLTTRIHKAFDVKIKLADIFRRPTIAGLATAVSGALKKHFAPFPQAEEREYYRLTPSQERFFFFQQMQPHDTSYHMNEIYELTGSLDRERLARTFQYLIRRHHTLRTSFFNIHGEAVQKVHHHRDLEFAVDFHDFSGDQGAVKDLLANFVRPFDLSIAPLLRVAVVKTADQEYLMTVDMHHIISDGTSTGIFIRDFLSFYQGRQLPTLRIQYKDYARWQEISQKTGQTKKETTSPHSDGPQELLELPTDFVRPALQDFSGDSVLFNIDEKETTALKSLALAEGVTLFMLLTAIFNVFLSRLSGQEDVVMGTPAAGRPHADLEDTMGLFINTLVIRNYPVRDKSFQLFLQEVKKSCLEAFQNQEHQYLELLEKTAVARDNSRNPLFDVMFVLQNMDMPDLEIPGLKISKASPEHKTSKFDLTLYCEEIENTLVFGLEYCTRLFKKSTITRFIGYFKKLLTSVTASPTAAISGLEIITEAEKRQIIYEFNDSAVDYPRQKTVYGLFEEQVQKNPQAVAVTGKTARGDEVSLTYDRLNRRVNRLARVLRQAGVGANSIVGIMLGRSLGLVEALYGVLKAGGAYLPMDPTYPEGRILSMLQNSKSSLLLTDTPTLEGKALAHFDLQVLQLDDLEESLNGVPDTNPEPLSRGEDLIYVIFTSGSTGVPKGAGVFQRSFVNLVNWFVTDFELGPLDGNLLTTSFSFDLTQKNFYASLISGGRLYIPGSDYFDPQELLREIERRAVTWINCTPSMFFQIIEYCTPRELEKLKRLRCVYLGGEPLSMTMFMKWVESPYCSGQIVNTYGPTECTDISNAFRITQPHRYLREAVPLGKTVYNVNLYVVDKNLQLLPVGIPGELLIGGENMGKGYVNDKELTAKKFIYHSFLPGEPKRLMYRTGDLVKWLADGSVEFIGRMDFQVKIRGFRIEIGEIESLLLAHQGIKEAIVVDRDNKEGEKYLCAYFVADLTPASPGTSSPGPALSPEDLKNYLSQTLPDYMVPAYFVELPQLPLNPNGKVNRKALPAPKVEAGKEYHPPRTSLEKRLVALWSEVLGVAAEHIGIDHNFFELGGHSLKATALTTRLHKEMEVEVGLREIFARATVGKLAEYIAGLNKSAYSAVAAMEERDYYPLSSIQKRLYILRQADREGTRYNIPAVFTLKGKVDSDRFQRVFNRLIQRHESLRTSFIEIVNEQEPVQRIHHRVDFQVQYDRPNPAQAGHGGSEAGQVEKIVSSFIRPFDLSRAPLLRVGLVELAERQYILIFDVHHIVADGLSLTILAEEFMTLYRGRQLPDLELGYKDYCHWQETPERKEAAAKERSYWADLFKKPVPLLNLPVDFPHDGETGNEGLDLEFRLGADQADKLQALAQEEGLTMFMLLLSCYLLLLSKLSGQNDIVVGTPVAGRSHAQLEPLVGMFVNTLALRNSWDWDWTFQRFLQEIKTQTLEAFDNRDYPFEDLVANVDFPKAPGRSPLFDVMFSNQDMGAKAIKIPGLELADYPFGSDTVKFDLVLNFIETETGLLFYLKYKTRLFKSETIEGYVQYFKEIVAAVIADKTVKLSDIEIGSRLAGASTAMEEVEFGF